MNIAFIASEAVPFAKTGGLADVAGALPKALEKLGGKVKLFLPKYGSIDDSAYDIRYNWEIGEIQIKIGDNNRPAYVHNTKLPGSNVDVIFIDSPHFFNRGKLYTNDNDENERFILFNKAVIETIKRLNWSPDIIHCNDWQTGLIPLLIKENYRDEDLFNKTASLFTIHNIGYQGNFGEDTVYKAGINNALYYPGGPTEYYGSFSFLKTALVYSDMINTVSKTYSEEILTPEYGTGMENILASKKDVLFGILNGVDYKTWNPETDKLIPFRFAPNYLTGKLKNKRYLLEHFNLPFDQNVPLIGIVSRLAVQKGFDLIEESINDLMSINAQWIILGSGEVKYENLFMSLVKKSSDKVAAYIGFNNELSHLIEAASDIFLMPSHYEPCGLNQIYSLKYGTVPVVRSTGGLADTVANWNPKDQTGNGFSFKDYSSVELVKTMNEAVNIFKDKKAWRIIQQNGMSKDYSWNTSAEEYFKLYNSALGK